MNLQVAALALAPAQGREPTQDRALLSQALYIDCLDSRPGDQVKLLAQLRSRPAGMAQTKKETQVASHGGRGVAETLRSSPAEDAAPEWLEEGWDHSEALRDWGLPARKLSPARYLGAFGKRTA